VTRLAAAYRRTGADGPFGDPRRAHGVGMEGHFWRFTDAAAGRVVIVLCGVSRAADGGTWALVALAAHPGGVRRHALVPVGSASPDGFGVTAGDVLAADDRTLRVRLAGAELDAALDPVTPWPRRTFGALGPAHAIPALGQYWHPHLLLGGVRGEVRLDGEPWSLDAATAYAEKNWGSAFAGHWWWGQAHGFADGATTVAFAGGRLLGGAPTSLVVALEDRVLRLSPPLARTVVATAPDRWRVEAAGPRHRVEVVAEAEPGGAHLLPVPVPGERRVAERSRQHLAGRLELTVRRSGRVVHRAESQLAGLERGTP
jgi:Tocopherol cyclase